MEVLIPPAAAATQGLIFEDRHDRHGHHHGHPIDTAAFFQSQAEAIEAIHSTDVNVEKNGAASQLATNVAAGALGVAIEKTSAANQLSVNVVGQQLQNTLLSQFNATNVQNLTFYNALNVQAEKLAAAGALLAVQNQAAVLAAQAECCCELKELIRAENGQTRDLINGNTIQGLRDVIVASQRLIPTNIPVPV